MKRNGLLALGLLLFVSSSALANTTVKLNFKTRLYRLDPPVGFVTGQIVSTAELTDDGAIAGSATVQGRSPQVLTSKSRLGVRSTDPNMVYRVLNRNTVQGVRTDVSHTSTITVRVSGQDCSMTAKFRLRPGHKEFILYSPLLGRDARYRSLELAESSCTIQ